jgi:protein-S-isoprenylcysteine O-methyltransferase Ste14
MSRVFAVVGGVLFVASLAYFGVSFAWRFAETDAVWSWRGGAPPLAVDLLLFTVFALHHSLFARTGLRAWIARVFPAPLERSIYVWIASLLFFVVCAAWQPVPGLFWHASGWPAALLGSVQIAGAVLAVGAARRLDALALAGVRQAFEADRSQAASPTPQAPVAFDRGPYALVRHPIYLGWFAMVWCTPLMNGTRLAFAAISCVYLILAIPFEERDLRKGFGAAYQAYAARVKWKIVPGVY